MSEDKSFEEEVSMFLRRNFPQIQMHGGESSIVESDPDEGFVRIMLGGACNGCGISPMTVEAIKGRMPKQVEAVEEVVVSTGMGGQSSLDTDLPTRNSDEETEDSNIEAPF